MKLLQKYDLGRILTGRLEKEDDLLLSLQAIAHDHGMHSGSVFALGAVQKAQLAYYNQQTQTYQSYELNKPLEILNLTGNLSLKEGEIMLHAHVTLSDEKGSAFGGHLNPGTLVFACEFAIYEHLGTPWEREKEASTGLPLWKG